MTLKEEKKQGMFALIESWKASGKSQYEFAKSSGVAQSNFQYWYRKYRQQHEASSAFVAVKIRPETPEPIFAELVLGEGKRIKFYQRVEASFLRSLIQ